jgi:uncharacterized membrane protein YhaH (DUF805 family)
VWSGAPRPRRARVDAGSPALAEPASRQVNWAWFFLRFNGRVNRTAFFLGGLFLGVLAMFPFYRFLLVPPESGEAQLWASLFYLVILPSLWVQAALGVKRLHDMGKPGFAAVSLFVFPISLIAFVVLCVFPGEPGPNQYGRETNSPG